MKILSNRYGSMSVCTPKVLNFQELVDFVEANTVYPKPAHAVWRSLHAHSTCTCIGPDGKFLHTEYKHYTLTQRTNAHSVET